MLRSLIVGFSFLAVGTLQAQTGSAGVSPARLAEPDVVFEPIPATNGFDAWVREIMEEWNV
ncbi:MAG: hypothetical protein ACE5HT_15685, partial [Gemmatimonadales bacterium]